MNDFFRDTQGNPMLLLGLQAHNSSTGTPMIDRAIRAVQLYGGNLLEAPIYWYAIEPRQDVYDMTLLRDLIDKTRAAGLKLIVLWFGTSKNGHPNYVPEYVKLDPATYRLALGVGGVVLPALSPHCAAALERDRKAFCEVMAFLRDYDGEERTVVAVQVENEMGISGTDRDYSDLGEAAYALPVPEEIRGVALEDTGLPDGAPAVPVSAPAADGATWRGVFGRHAHEAFSAWHHARYINAIAEAGKAIYDIPLTANAWIGEMGIEEAGVNYPSGGLVGRVLDIWKIAAPALDLLCPDIYRPAKRDFTRIARRYARPDNALFIPESAPTGVANALNAIWAVAELGAIGICGFGAENALLADGTLSDDARTMAISMKAMAALAPLLIRFRGTGKVHAILQEEFADRQYLRLARWHVEAKFISAGAIRGLSSTINMRDPANRWHLEERGRAILIEAGEDEFYLAGAGVGLDFTRRPDPHDPNPYATLMSRQATQLNFLSVEEGHFEGDTWVVDFIRNGDESNFQLFVHGGQVVRIRLTPAGE